MPLIRLFLPLALLLVVSCRTAAPPPSLPPHEKGGARARWMYEQRAYPFDSVPHEARRKAWEETVRTRMRVVADSTANEPRAFWRPIGPKPVQVEWPWETATGRVKAVAVSPVDSQLVLIGASSGGIWRSTNGGTSFTPVADDHVDLSVGAIAFAPSDPRVVYAAMGSDFLGTGVLRSTDAGATWRLVSGSTFFSRGTAVRVVVDRTNPNRLWIAQSSRQDATTGRVSSSGVVVSNDGGVSWSMTLPGVITDFVSHPTMTDTLYAGVSTSDDERVRPGIHRSTDGGATWSVIYSGNPDTDYPPSYTIAVAGSRIYAHAVVSNELILRPRFVRSDDYGITWSQETATSLPEARSAFLHADPFDPAKLYIGFHDRDGWRSVDGGATWTNMTRNINPNGFFDPAGSVAHIDQHALAFTDTPGAFYLGNDGGAYFTRDGGATFQSLAGTLSLVQAYRITAHPGDASLLYLGTQDNGLERRNRDGSWEEIITGDYGTVVFNINDPSRFIANYVQCVLVEFARDGAEFKFVVATAYTFGEPTLRPPRVGFIAPLEYSRQTGHLFFGTWRLFVSRDFADNWTAPAGTLDLTKGDDDVLSAIGLSPVDPQLVYTGSHRGRIMLSRDEGATWTDVTAGLPDRSARAIATDRRDAAVAYVAFSGYRTDHVFMTRDYGASWQSISSGLPDVPVNALIVDPANTSVLYAGTDVGVFRRDLSENEWKPFSEGMPPVVVTSFDVTAAGRIVASTYGRGAYELVPPTLPRRRSAGR